MPPDFSRPHRMLDVGHARLASWTFGNGPDLVFVHGWPLSAATFRHVVERLQDRYTCHLFDLPGSGATETTPETRIGIPEHAATVRAAIDQLGLSRYALLAHDSGAFIARLVAADDPRVVGLVMTNTEIPGHTPGMIKVFFLLAKLGLAGAMLRRVLRSPTLRRTSLGFGGCFADPAFIDGEFKTAQLDPLLRPGALDGQMRLIRSLSPKLMGLLETSHARIRVPVALVWGTDDPWFPLAGAKAMRSGFAGPTTLTEIPGGKLLVHEDHPDEVAEAASELLSRAFAPALLGSVGSTAA